MWDLAGPEVLEPAMMPAGVGAFVVWLLALRRGPQPWLEDLRVFLGLEGYNMTRYDGMMCISFRDFFVQLVAGVASRVRLWSHHCLLAAQASRG